MDNKKYYKDIVIVKCQPKRRAGSVDAPRIISKDFVGHPIVGLQNSNKCNSNSVCGLNSIGISHDRKVSLTGSNKENYGLISSDKIKKSNEKKLIKDINHNNLTNFNTKISSNQILVDKKNNQINKPHSNHKKLVNNTDIINVQSPTKFDSQTHLNQNTSNSNSKSIRKIPQAPVSSERKLSQPHQRITRASQSPARFQPFPNRAGSQPPFGNGVIGCGSGSFKEKLNKFNNASTEDLTAKKRTVSQPYPTINKINFSGCDSIYHNSLNYRKNSAPNCLSITTGGFQSEGRVAGNDHLPQYVRSLRSPSQDRITYRPRSSSRDRAALRKRSPSPDRILPKEICNTKSPPCNDKEKSRSISLVPSSPLYNRRRNSTTTKPVTEDVKLDAPAVRPTRCSVTVLTESPTFQRNVNKNEQNSIVKSRTPQAKGHKTANYSQKLVNQNTVESNPKSNSSANILPKLQFKPINSISVETSIVSPPHSVLQNSKIRPYSKFSNNLKDFVTPVIKSPLQEVNKNSLNTEDSNNNNIIFSPVENTKIRPFIKSPITEDFKPFPQTPFTPSSSSSDHCSSLPISIISSPSGDKSSRVFSPSVNFTAKIGNKNSLSSTLRERKKELEVTHTMESKTKVQDIVAMLKSIKPTMKPLPGYENEKIPRYVIGVCMDECFPGLYIGDLGSAMNKEYLQRVGITHVLNTAEGNMLSTVDTNSEFYSTIGIAYMGLQLFDIPSANIAQYFVKGADFIHECLAGGGKILVHCFMGISRSSTISASYLMQKHNMSVMEALKTLREHRSIYPNEGFMKQLIQLEESLNNKT